MSVPGRFHSKITNIPLQPLELIITPTPKAQTFCCPANNVRDAVAAHYWLTEEAGTHLLGRQPLEHQNRGHFPFFYPSVSLHSKAEQFQVQDVLLNSPPTEKKNIYRCNR